MAVKLVKGLLGRKVGMTSVFDEQGRAVPVTVVQAGPCWVVQRRTSESTERTSRIRSRRGQAVEIKSVKTEGYDSVQLGFDTGVKEKRITKPMQGHFKKAGIEPVRYLEEFRIESDSDIEIGAQVTVDVFEKGDLIKVAGISKGRGFAGAMRRWGFGGFPASHGATYHRKPASAGAGGPQHVFKGKRGPGRMGSEKISVRGLTIFDLDSEQHLLLVKGSVPGANGGLLRIEAM